MCPAKILHFSWTLEKTAVCWQN